MIKIAVLFTLVAFVVNVLSKQDMTVDSIGLSRNENDNDRSIIDSEQLGNNTIEPKVEGVEVEDGILKFEDIEAFGVMIRSLVNQPCDKLNAWESALGFKSIRSLNEAILVQGGNILDGDLFDDSRIQDPAFETVLNEDNKIIIGREGFTFNYCDMDNRFMTVWDANDPNMKLKDVNLDSCQTDSANFAIFSNHKNRITKSTKYLSEKSRIVGKKGYQLWAIYASVFMSTSYSEKNRFGLWIEKEANLGVKIEQWHSLAYNDDELIGAVVSVSNFEMVGKTKKLTCTLTSTVGDADCDVYDFGRVHHWKVSEGYNSNAYNEQW